MMRNEESSALENRIVGALRREKLIRTSTPWYLRHSAATGGLVLLLAIFLLAGQVERTALTDGEPYMLALYTGPSYQHPQTGEARARAEEYGRWAASHRDGAATVVGGEELGGTVASFGPPVSGVGKIAGFFLVRAASREDAVALARSSPHLRHGGTIMVREIRE